jgi:hypothetical protein
MPDSTPVTAAGTSLPWQACRRKVRYDSRNQARHGASRTSAHHRKKGLHVYQCRHCDGWHLTSQERR